MRKTRVFIWGSCVSRDTFEHFPKDEFDLIHYVARQSALSAYSKPVTLAAPPKLSSPFQQRMVTGDFESNLREVLTSRANDIDLLLIDLVDERHGIYLLPDGSVVTRSVELIQSGAEQELPAGTHYIPFGSKQHVEYWSQAIESIGAMFDRLVPKAAIALLDIPWAATTRSGDPTPDSYGLSAHDANTMFRTYMEVAAHTLKARIISLTPEEVTAGAGHPWGPAPFHYSEDVYLAAVLQLTNSPGTAVWSAGDEEAADTTANDSTSGEGAIQKSSLQDLDVRDITGRTWRLTIDDGSDSMLPIRLNADGTILGLAQENASEWRLAETSLTFTDDKGIGAMHFDTFQNDGDDIKFTGTTSGHDDAAIDCKLEAIDFDWDTCLTSETRLVVKALRREIELLRAGLDEVRAARHGDRTLLGKGTWVDPSCVLISKENATIRIGDHTQVWRGGEWTGPVNVGNRVFVNQGSYIRPLVTIEDDVSLGPFVRLISDTHEISTGPRRTGTPRKDPILVKRGAWIGAGATVMGGVVVGSRSVVAAGAVVIHDVPDNVVVAGVPARVVRELDALPADTAEDSN